MHSVRASIFVESFPEFLRNERLSLRFRSRDCVGHEIRFSLSARRCISSVIDQCGIEMRAYKTNI